MKKTLKKILGGILTLICAICLLMMVAESDNFIAQIITSLGAMLTFLASVKLMDKLGFLEEDDKDKI